MDRLDDSLRLTGEVLADRYRIVKIVGRGAMGSVYEARHAVLGRRLAVKVLRKDCSENRLRERFFHEARAASAIDHEHVVSVLDFGVLPGRGQPYLVMEFIDGESLEKCITKSGAFPVEQAVEIIRQLLSALEMVHAAGLVHRDVKPANITMVRGRGRDPFIKLLDFGVAGVLDHNAWGRDQLTRIDQVVGTPAYLAPEQASGGKVSPKWDLWAAGVVFYELLSGRLPYRIENMRQLAKDIIECRLTPVEQQRTGLPRWLIGVMHRIHHHEPARRFGSASLMLAALEQRQCEPDEQKIRTTPFRKVDLATPPPELVGRHPSATSKDETRAGGQPSKRQVTRRHGVPSSPTVPIREHSERSRRSGRQPFPAGGEGRGHARSPVPSLENRLPPVEGLTVQTGEGTLRREDPADHALTRPVERQDRKDLGLEAADLVFGDPVGSEITGGSLPSNMIPVPAHSRGMGQSRARRRWVAWGLLVIAAALGAVLAALL